MHNVYSEPGGEFLAGLFCACKRGISMLCYKDRTWCPEFIHRDCTHKNTCDRVLTREVQEKAIDWWGDDNAPIRIFSSKPDCYKGID